MIDVFTQRKTTNETAGHGGLFMPSILSIQRLRLEDWELGTSLRHRVEQYQKIDDFALA